MLPSDEAHVAMARVTRAFADEGIKPFDINNGSCYDWAQNVLDILQDSPLQVELWECPHDISSMSHAFLRINDLFYDAECPEGVIDHMDLPLFSVERFKETAEQNNDYIGSWAWQPVWCIDANHDVTGENRRDFSSMDEEIMERESSSLFSL